MSSRIKEMRKNRSSLFDKLAHEMESKTKKTFVDYNKVDERLFTPVKDKAGNAVVTFRFLPSTVVGNEPWVKLVNHSFFNEVSGKKLWYIENCPWATLSQPCPVCEANRILWKTKDKADEEVARTRGCKVSFYSNILIVDDPKTPENNGKVFIFKYGPQIHFKLLDLMFPERVKGLTEEEIVQIKAELESGKRKRVDVSDIDLGRNFKLRISEKTSKINGKTVKFPNYEKSEFLEQSVLAEDDSEIDSILDKCYDLSEYSDPKLFKSYAALAARFAIVTDEKVVEPEDSDEDEDNDDIENKPVVKSKVVVEEEIDEDDDAEEDEVEEVVKPVVKTAEKVATIEEDEMDAYFKSLAESED